MKLTQRNTAAFTLPEGKTDHIFWDDMPGFGFRLRLGGGGKINRTWVYQYRFGGATRRLLLGNAALGADQARKLARKALGNVAHGKDPQTDKQDRRGKNRLTLSALVEKYLEAKKTELRPRSLIETKRYLKKGYFKPLHSKPVDTITRAHVAERIVTIMKGDTAKMKGGKAAASRARATLSGFFVWAMEMGLADANPVIGSVKPSEAEDRTRVLSYPELAAIWEASGDDDYGKIIRLLILTGCRRQEIGGLCWSEFDDPENPTTWTLPAERSKNGRPHVLPVMEDMLDIIKTVPRMASRDQLFGSRAGSGFVAWSRGKKVLDARSGVKQHFTTHDLRRTVSTRMNDDLGVLPHIVEQVLNHARSGHKRGVAGKYNHAAYAREVKAALGLWHDRVRSLVEGTERKVILMPQAAS